ncbi:MAG: hypothetical protein MMC33_004200 [Icmadophila ericetorum]|nr:hypothetical protein [Icmadophila ericetorum]
MVCNLWDPVDSRTAQTGSQTVLAGTLVSSLHRLKDVDNTDGGFFVFGDLSVKIEGEFRLRFSLFEMKKLPKMEVVYIKSIVSAPFTVYGAKAFPERRLGLYCKRLRNSTVNATDKGSKRAPPSSSTVRSDEYINPYSTSNRRERVNTVGQWQQFPQGGTGSANSLEGSTDFVEPSAKRPKTSHTNSRDSYDQDLRHVQRSFIPQSTSYPTYTPQSATATQFAPSWTQAPLQSPATISEFTFRYPQPDSASASSPYVSPRSQYPNQTPNTQPVTYQQQSRYTPQTFVSNQYSAALTGQMTRLPQQSPTPLQAQYTTIEQTQPEATNSYTAFQAADESSVLSQGLRQSLLSNRDSYYQYPQQAQAVEQLIRPTPQRQNSYNTPLPNVLPPLQASVPAIPSFVATAPTYSNYVTPTDSRLISQTTPPSMQQRPQDSYVGYSQGNVVRQLHREAG